VNRLHSPKIVLNILFSKNFELNRKTDKSTRSYIEHWFESICYTDLSRAVYFEITFVRHQITWSPSSASGMTPNPHSKLWKLAEGPSIRHSLYWLRFSELILGLKNSHERQSSIPRISLKSFLLRNASRFSEIFKLIRTFQIESKALRWTGCVDILRIHFNFPMNAFKNHICFEIPVIDFEHIVINFTEK